MNVEFEQVKDLLRPGKRRVVEASAKLRAMAILDASLSGSRVQPSESDLNNLIGKIKTGTKWTDLFPGVAALDFATEGTGLKVSVHLSKKGGQPVHLVPEGAPGATVVAVQKVDKLGFYNLGLYVLAEKVGLNPFQALAVIRYLKIQDDPENYSEFQIGSQTFKRYSQKALEIVRKQLPGLDVVTIAKKFGPKKKAVEAAAAAG